MLTVVLWKWGTKYGARHVNVMGRMLRRNLSQPFRIVCLTDDPSGLDKEIETQPVPYRDDNKYCRRLWIFSAEAKRLGTRLLQIDLDVVITASIDPLVNRPEPLVLWKSESTGPTGYGFNPTFLLVTAGSHRWVWEAYQENPAALFRTAKKQFKGSDQAILGHLFCRREVAYWTEADGVISYRKLAQVNQLPAGTRVVSLHGYRDPSDDERQRIEWVKKYWN